MMKAQCVLMNWIDQPVSWRRWLLVCWLVLAAVGSSPAAAEEPVLLPCGDRPTQIDPPWVSATDWCLEKIIQDESGGELSFTALAAAPDGTLYAARPLAGEIYALTDGNGDGLPETATRLLEGLTLPNALAYANDSLYISGGPHVYVYRDERLTVLVNDLPTGTGFWTGGIAIGPDGRLYVGIGAECDACIPGDPARGTILSFAADGSDRQVIAEGLRQPAGLAFRDGVLWAGDTVRNGLDDIADLDELNRIETGTHYGWPYCIGGDNLPDLQSDFDCARAAKPALTLPTQSTPVALTTYSSSTLPAATDSLLVVLSGNYNRSVLTGYTLVMIHFNESGQPLPPRTILPEAPTPERIIPIQKIHYQASGFWPHRPLGVTVSREGWIFVSAGGGRIYALRPR